MPEQRNALVPKLGELGITDIWVMPYDTSLYETEIEAPIEIPTPVEIPDVIEKEPEIVIEDEILDYVYRYLSIIIKTLFTY